MNNFKQYKQNFKKVEEKGDFALYLNYPIWKQYRILEPNENIVLKHKVTGEILKENHDEIIILYDDKFNLLDEPIFEDCYDLCAEVNGKYIKLEDGMSIPSNNSNSILDSEVDNDSRN